MLLSKGFSRGNIVLFFCLIFAALTFSPFLIDTASHTVRKSEITPNELFDSKLTSLKSLDMANEYIDSTIRANRLDVRDTSILVSNISSFTKRRFYHGLSRYSYKDNWIAALSGNLFWEHFSAIVDPNDALSHDEGLCSQQAIVFMELLKRKGIKNRSVGLGYKEGPGHFLTEVYYNKEWHLYDVNKEPKWEKITNHHMSMEYYKQNKDTLFVAYEDQMSKSLFFKMMEKVQYGTPGDFPARNMLLFHKVSKVVVVVLPYLFIILAIRTYIRQRNKLKRESKIQPRN